MRHFAALTLRGKLIALAMVISSVALVVATSGQFLYQMSAYRSAAMQQLELSAKLVADSAIAPLTFGDAAAAQDLLDSLHSDPHLIAAALYGHHGQRVAAYRRQEFAGGQPGTTNAANPNGNPLRSNNLPPDDTTSPNNNRNLDPKAGVAGGAAEPAAANEAGSSMPNGGTAPPVAPNLRESKRAAIADSLLPATAPEAKGVQPTNEGFDLAMAVMSEGNQVGTLLLRRDAADMESASQQYLALSCGLLATSFVMAYFMATRVQHLISDPIRELVATADRVIAQNDYSARARRTNPDELGELVDRFNGMLQRVQTRDEALQAAQDELEQRVRERTSKLQAEVAERIRVEADLRESKAKAEESNRAKSIFLASMSHELRTPLNAIIGYGELIQESAESEAEQQAYGKDADKIVRAGRHLLTLINEILDFSKIEAGRMEIHPEVVVMANLLDDVMVAIEPAAQANSNQLEILTEQAPSTIYTDAVRFRQSLLNLLGNACKFTKNGLVKLEVLQSKQEGQPWLECRVSDTGIGISEEDQKKLFQSFSQVDNSLTRSFGGTGLGLSISQKLCQMMGGEITVQSELGKGSTFTMRLPLKQPEPVNPLGLPQAPGLNQLNTEISLAQERLAKEKARLALIHT